MSDVHDPGGDAAPIAAEHGLTTAGGYSVPVDPMDLLQCDSCQ
jgi:hypothetical protein